MATSASLTDTQQHYLRLWDEADKILKQPNNPCQIKAVGDGTFSCAGCGKNQLSKQLCCDGCKHHSSSGCTVKALSCKLAWCWISSASITGQLSDSHPTFIAISRLREEARRLKIPMYGRASFEQTFPTTCGSATENSLSPRTCP